MRKTMIALVLALILAPAVASAQSFEKKNYTYSEWTKGLFSEAVTVSLPGAKMIFLAGVGAEDEGATRGVIRHLGDVVDGELIWAPSIAGAVVLTTRGGDFGLHLGQDLSIGYLSHTEADVTLYLQESFTFQLLTTEAAVALRTPATP